MNPQDNKRLGELIILLTHKNKTVCDAAITEIYDRMNKILYSVGNTRYPTKEDVEDSIQNLLFALFLKADTYREDENACGWIMQIYRNSFNNYNKRRKLETVYFKKQVQKLCEQHSDFNNYTEKYFLLNYVIGELKGYERELFFMRYLYGYSIGEIATELKKPKSTIQSHLDKLDAKIKKLLEF